MVHERYRKQIRLCTASFAYSTAIVYQLDRQMFYPELIEPQFHVLGLAWVVLIVGEPGLLDQTDHGAHFVALRSFLGMNALFSLMAGVSIEPILTSFPYELTAFLSVALVATVSALTIELTSAAPPNRDE